MDQSSSKLTNLTSNSNNWMSSSRQSNALLLVASVVLLSYMHVLFLNTDPGLSGNVSSTRRLSDQPRLAVIQKAPTTTTKTTKLSQSEKNHRSTLSSTSSSPSSNFWTLRWSTDGNNALRHPKPHQIKMVATSSSNTSEKLEGQLLRIISWRP